MSPALIHGEADQWLASREAWLAASPARRALVDAWNECAVKYGAGNPAALGCLLALVREAMGEPRLSTRCGRDREWPWSVETGCDDEIGAVRGKTEAAALVAALQGAP